MSKNPSTSDYWKIKLSNGQIKGPYTTDIVSKMIVEGVFTGQEQIIGENQSDWNTLDRQPEFYEAVLEALENPIERDEKKAQKMEAETVIQKVKTVVKKNNASTHQDDEPLSGKVEDDNYLANLDQDQPIEKNLKKEIKELVKTERMLNQHGYRNLKVENKKTGSSVPTLHSHLEISPATNKNNENELLKQREEQLTIELNQIKQIQAKYRQKAKIILPLGLIVFVILMYFIFAEDQQTSGWILIAPDLKKQNVKPLASTELKSLKARAVSLIKSGTLENTRASQKFLVQAIEGAPQDLESIGLLCVVYQQLWPYTKQTTHDLKAVTITTQLSRSLNAISSYADTCQSVNLLIKGQPRDARALIEKTLDQKSEEKFILFPFLYLIRGEIYEENANYTSAEAYYQEASKLFPDWHWSMFAQARTLYKQNKLNEAKDIYERIIKKNPNYKGALFGLALIEKKLESNDKAAGLFANGFILSNKLPKSFYIESLQEYVRLLMVNGENQKALEVAQFALTISPSHKGLKDTVISLGGDERNNNAASELVFLGDQFARSGDHLAAQAQYKAAFDYDSNNALIALKTAKSLWMINQTRDAMLWVDKAIKADRKFYAAYALKADYLSQKYNFVEASKTLLDANKINSQSFDIQKAQAQVEYRKNNLVAAIAYGEKAYKIYDADIELLALLANANGRLYLNLPSRDNEEELKKNKYKEDAQKYANKAVDLEPGLPEAQITYAKYLSVASSTLAAENYFKKLIETFQYTTEYRIGLAEFYETLERFKSASEIYKQIVDLDPKNKKALMGLARTYQFTNEPKLAQKYYMQAAVIDPSDVEPLFATAQLELETANSENASAMIKSALNKFKMVRDINSNYPRISFFIAKCYLEMGDFDKAIEMTNEEKKKNPNIADSYILAAQVYNAKQQYKECAAEYSLGIKLRPTSAELYIKAAACYRKSEAIDIAQDMIDIAIQKENGNALIYLEKGYINEAKGMKKEAAFAFRLYLELSPNAPDRNLVEAKIKSLGGL